MASSCRSVGPGDSTCRVGSTGAGAGTVSPLHVRLEDRRVDVVLAADRPGIAQALRHDVHRLDDVAPGLSLARRRAQCPECLGRQHRPGPGPEVLRGDGLPIALAQVLVDVPRIHRAALAVVVEILEELLAGQGLAVLDDPGQPLVGQDHVVPDPALAPELEAHLAAVHLHVTLAERGQAVGAVLARVFVVADPDVGLFQQAHHERQDPLPPVPVLAQVPLDLLAQLGQELAEFEDPLELGFVPDGAVLRSDIGTACGPSHRAR